MLLAFKKLTMRNFRTLNIWKEGIALVKKIYKLTEIIPSEEKYGLKSQMCRAAVSIPSNIAEGCSRSSEIEFKRFLEIAIGSAFELETQLIILNELGFATQELLDPILELLNNEQKMINGLISKIKQTTKS